MTLALPISIVSDIGGTNTRVALARDGQMIEASIRRYRNIGYAGLEPILIEYLEAEGVAHCDGACIAVAGPVRDGEAEMTNLDWSMTDASIRTATGAPTVALLNDLQAQGHALGHLNEASLRHIVAEPGAGPKAAKLVIGVGTGFNAAPVHETPHGRLVAASECGHVNLPVRTAADLRLMSYIEQLEDAHGLASVEDVLSGRGLERVYTWAASEARQSQERTAA